MAAQAKPLLPTKSPKKFDDVEKILVQDQGSRSSREHLLYMASVVLTFSVSIVRGALPRWLNSRWPGTKLHSTSWLDALRGYAAWFVLNQHKFAMKERFAVHYYPFVNVFFGGAPAVDMFFVISGFVLSQRMIQNIRANHKQKVLESLSSAIMRRWLRLFLPCCAMTFFAMVLVHFGIMKGPHFRSFSSQVRHWAGEFAVFSDPLVPIVGWNSPEVTVNMSYIDYLWTIAVEFRGSVIVYLFIAATSRMRSLHRLLVGLFLALYFFSLQNTYAALFLAGTCLAEISLIRFPDRYASAELPTTASRGENTTKLSEVKPAIWLRIVYVTTLVVALFISGCDTAFHRKHPSYEILRPFTPLLKWDHYARKHYWPSMSAVLLVWTIDSWPILQKPLFSRFSQILGKLSFGIYMMQKIVLTTVFKKVLAPFLRQEFHGNWWWFGAVLITLINYIAVAWAADLFDRLDGRIVKLVRKASDLVIVA